MRRLTICLSIDSRCCGRRTGFTLKSGDRSKYAIRRASLEGGEALSVRVTQSELGPCGGDDCDGGVARASSDHRGLLHPTVERGGSRGRNCHDAMCSMSETETRSKAQDLVSSILSHTEPATLLMMGEVRE